MSTSHAVQVEQGEMPRYRQRAERRHESGTQPRRYKVYEKARTLRIIVQDVKNVQVAKEAMEGVVGTQVPT